MVAMRIHILVDKHLPRGPLHQMARTAHLAIKLMPSSQGTTTREMVDDGFNLVDRQVTTTT